MKSNAILILIYFLIISVCNAQPPQTINYQGVARNAQGLPLINRSIAIRLGILDSSVTGQAVYVETHNTISNNSGLFNLSIGLGTAVTGTFDSIQWGQGDKWLKIEMDTSGGSNYQLIGTTQFMSVPYSLYSKNGISGNANAGDMAYYNGTSWISVPGGGYGQFLAFCNGVPTWGGCLPILTTSPISNINSFIATGGGIISNNGGTPITDRGVCWSINTGPTVALSTKTSSGSGIGSFNSAINNLAPSTTYYVRAYATNSAGTSYGNEISFTSLVAPNFPSVVICSQIWMTQNLSVNNYRNGDPIPNVTDMILWAGLTTGAWCWYNNDSVTYASTYGKLYNWYAVNDPRGLAPIGWHIPTDSEWSLLVACIDPSADTNCICTQSFLAGGAMKEMGTAHWTSPNTGASNSSGFTALPAGYRSESGIFGGIGGHIFWWSYTQYNTIYSWTRDAEYSNGSTIRTYGNKKIGLSVRCVKD